MALQLSEKYKSDGSRIAWVSIRLPEQYSNTFDGIHSSMYSSMYGNQEILSIVVTDLALRKIGLESLVLLCTNSMSFKPDVLNRVSSGAGFSKLLHILGVKSSLLSSLNDYTVVNINFFM